MKYSWSFIFIIVLAVTLGIEQVNTGKKAPQQPEVNKPPPPTTVPAGKPHPKKSDKEPWPRTFVPTEKITADSVVSFPADI